MNYLRIADIGRSANPSPGPRLLALLNAYFDYSSTEPAGITSVAGYVAPLEEWERVEAEWAEGLRYWDIDPFHLANLERNLGREKAELCERYFEKIITDSGLDAIGAALIDADWRQSEWEHMTTPKLPTAYQQCLDMALECLGQHAGDYFKGHDIAVFCDRDASENSIQAVFENRRVEYQRFVTVTIGGTDKILPLQCADLGAGKLRKSWLEITTNEASELPWGGLPRGRKYRTSFWSLHQGAVLARAIRPTVTH
jgi:hypothetical protein